MGLSGQALELVNQIMKKIKGTNGRYSENHRTGAKPSKKMGVGRIEQLVKRMTSKSKAKAKMQGTWRQRERENRDIAAISKKITVKTDAEIEALKQKHNYVTESAADKENWGSR